MQRFVLPSSKSSECFLIWCAVGDFGLATSSLAAVDPSDVSPILVTPDADMTLGMALFRTLGFSDVPNFVVEVGTKLYIAPEVQSRKRGPRNHTKADMYSLGVNMIYLTIFCTLIGL